MMNPSRVTPQDLVIPQVGARFRCGQTTRTIILLVAPALLLVVLTATGWEQVLQTEDTVNRIGLTVRRSLQVDALVEALQVERGRTAMLLSYRGDPNETIWQQLGVERQRTNEQLQRLMDWSYINITVLNTTYMYQKPLQLAEHITKIRSTADMGTITINDTLRQYTTIIHGLINSLLGKMEEINQLAWLPTLQNFLQATDKVGLLRAWGSAVWVVCDHTVSSIVALAKEQAQLVTLMDAATRQSMMLRDAFDGAHLAAEELVEQIVQATDHLMSEEFKSCCLELKKDERLEMGHSWFNNMTVSIKRLSTVRDAFLAALQEDLHELRYKLSILELLYSFIIVLTVSCSIGSAYTIFSSIKMSWKLHDFAHKIMITTKEIEEERKKCDDLLHQMLPSSIAEQLKHNKSVQAEYFNDVTIFFSDIVGFTQLAAQITPGQVIQFLNSLYSIFDMTIEEYDVYKVETIGDAYMVASGLPITNGNKHAENIAFLSLTLQEKIKGMTISHIPGWELQLRIGIHSGPCAAGVVGMRMPRYCLFGDTVNTASRMESTGRPMKIHISDSTHARLNSADCFHMISNGQTYVKGKGLMMTYWLESYRSVSSQSLTSIDMN